MHITPSAPYPSCTLSLLRLNPSAPQPFCTITSSLSHPKPTLQTNTVSIYGGKIHRWRPYRVKYTGSLLNSEVKWHRAWSVLGWGTAWEALKVLPAFFPLFSCFKKQSQRTLLHNIIQTNAKKHYFISIGYQPPPLPL